MQKKISFILEIFLNKLFETFCDNLTSSERYVPREGDNANTDTYTDKDNDGIASSNTFASTNIDTEIEEEQYNTLSLTQENIKLDNKVLNLVEAKTASIQYFNCYTKKQKIDFWEKRYTLWRYGSIISRFLT